MADPLDPLSFRSVTVRPVSRSLLAVEWSLGLLSPPADRWRFHVDRALSPEGPFDRVGRDLVNTFSFRDAVDRSHRWVEYHYRIGVEDRHTGREALSQVAHVSHEVDPESVGLSQELARSLRYGLGVPVWFVIRLRDGVRCTDCWDPHLKRLTTSRCLNCYRTGFVGDYATPIEGHARLWPETRILRHLTIQRLESNQTTAWKAGWPVLLPGDLIVERGVGNRWRVGNPLRNYARGKDGYVFRQELVLSQIAREDVEYDLELSL